MAYHILFKSHDNHFYFIKNVVLPLNIFLKTLFTMTEENISYFFFLYIIILYSLYIKIRVLNVIL